MRSRSVAALVAAFVLVPAGQAAATGGGHGGGDRQLEEYAAKTWASFEAMTDERSGLPSDILNADGTRSVQTSTTNIGAYMWSAVVAQRLGFIGKRELERRLERTLASVERLERPQNTGGQFYNWYDHRTGAKLTAWPPTGAPLTPILSSVDNGWLAVGLRIVENSVPKLSRRAGALYASMDFGFYYRPERQPDPVPLRARHGRPRRAVTTPSSARAGSPTTSGSRAGRCRRRPTSGAGARSPTPATGPGRRPSRSASGARTSA